MTSDSFLPKEGKKREHDKNEQLPSPNAWFLPDILYSVLMLILTCNVPAHKKFPANSNKREGRIIDKKSKIRQMHKKTENNMEAGEAELESRRI